MAVMYVALPLFRSLWNGLVAARGGRIKFSHVYLGSLVILTSFWRFRLPNLGHKKIFL